MIRGLDLLVYMEALGGGRGGLGFSIGMLVHPLAPINRIIWRTKIKRSDTLIF